ncbi:MAG: hypothetical protein J6W64_06880 [Bacilli bacterium]|nr:hypothetical protein [Bacilli bacterium]
MESLRIKNNDVYRIEVNDNGEYIEFDLRDIGLKAKCYQALDDIDKIIDTYQPKLKEAQTDKEETLLEQQIFKKIRSAMDNFLGEGACQKIFGDRNYYEMFEDLMFELSKKRPELKGKSHLDILGFNAEKIAKRVQEKYKKASKNVI